MVPKESNPSRKRSSPGGYSESPCKAPSPGKWRSPRRCNGNRDEVRSVGENGNLSNGDLIGSPKSPRKELFRNSNQQLKWNPRDPAQMQTVKHALHVATPPAIVVCREKEQKNILEFCKSCFQQSKAGSLYVCGCPGTGKTLSIGKVKEYFLGWSKEVGVPSPDVLTINCTSLTSTSEIFSQMLVKFELSKGKATNTSPLQHLQDIFSQKKHQSGRMLLMIADEMDYLITRDHAVLHDLFMLTTLPFSRFILIGIANAIDLADRFLQKLEALNCKPVVITFRAYSKDQILKILQQRIMALGYDVFQPAALEYCARKVAATSGDIRKALDICRCAIEVLEAELKGSVTNKETEKVSFHHIETAISRSFKSPVVDIIQSLPQHQQVILCSFVRLSQHCKKNATTLAELNRSYSEICKSTQIRPVGMMDFASLCTALNDQGLLEIAQSRGDKSKKIKLKVDSSDITFALKGIRFFQNCWCDD
ncbi:cell division control protein 6 homolog [Zingiber officinale]|uniref:cell division control protein 6 homolog n=1 Tax=Zingiber officinale TaxID=94328 RepID=UPI001C4BB142|nr:cell division control protein 6 homolog [Zingiber officinale]